MPRLTRDGFATRVAGLFQVAAGALQRDGRVRTAVLGFDRRGDLVLNVLLRDPHEDLPDAPDVVVLPGVPADNVEHLARLVAERGVVAAVVIAEVWVAAGDAVGDLLDLHMLPSDHPAGVEAVVLAADFPAEVLTRVHAGRIERDSGGRPSLLPWPADIAAPEDLGNGLLEVLAQILPGQFGRSGR